MIRHNSAAKARHGGGMKAAAPALVLAMFGLAAHADPAQEARSATAACLSAVIDGAPVDDIDGDDVSIRRGKDPLSCTVQVVAGEPVVLREAVLAAIKRRGEIFTPARTSWAPAGAASRETFCDLPGRRAVAVFVTTAKPGGLPVLTATVFRTAQRDVRCDRDMGVQSIAADPTTSEFAKVDVPASDPPTKAQKKRRFPHIPGLPRRD